MAVVGGSATSGAAATTVPIIVATTAAVADKAAAPKKSSPKMLSDLAGPEVVSSTKSAQSAESKTTNVRARGAAPATQAGSAAPSPDTPIVQTEGEATKAPPVVPPTPPELAINPPAAMPTPAVHRPGVMQMQNGRPVLPSRAAAKEEIFVEGDFVVYPTHGVGKVEKIAVEDIAGHRLDLIHITFEENRMTLRVPVAKARSAGLRKLATRKLFDDALAVLKGRARIKRTMWSRRAQEYEAKINSGDPIAIAEVVRDLHRNSGQPDQSFSERQIYEAAMDRLAAELGALDETDKMTATIKLINFLKAI